MFCPECRAEHPEVCGTKVFVAAECPICFRVERPTILMPCYHGLCPACFEDMGGALAPQIFPLAALGRAAEKYPVDDAVDENLLGFVPPPTHEV
jgi:hypothetical protein